MASHRERRTPRENEFIEDMISSPDRIKRVEKELKKLQFSNPGPQMKRACKETRLRDRPSLNCTVFQDFQIISDLCDCLDPGCPGCFLPCSKCRSNKCGVVCREGRNWNYEHEVERNFITKQ